MATGMFTPAGGTESFSSSVLLAQRKDQVIYISDDDVSEEVGGLIDLTGINGSPAYKPKVPAVFRAEGNADCLCLVTMLPALLDTRIV